MNKINSATKIQAMVRGVQCRSRHKALETFIAKALEKGDVTFGVAGILMDTKRFGYTSIPLYLVPEAVFGTSVCFFCDVRKFFKGVEFEFLKKEGGGKTAD